MPKTNKAWLSDWRKSRSYIESVGLVSRIFDCFYLLSKAFGLPRGLEQINGPPPFYGDTWTQTGDTASVVSVLAVAAYLHHRLDADIEYIFANEDFATLNQAVGAYVTATDDKIADAKENLDKVLARILSIYADTQKDATNPNELIDILKRARTRRINMARRRQQLSNRLAEVNKEIKAADTRIVPIEELSKMKTSKPAINSDEDKANIDSSPVTASNTPLKSDMGTESKHDLSPELDRDNFSLVASTVVESYSSSVNTPEVLSSVQSNQAVFSQTSPGGVFFNSREQMNGFGQDFTQANISPEDSKQFEQYYSQCSTTNAHKRIADRDFRSVLTAMNSQQRVAARRYVTFDWYRQCYRLVKDSFSITKALIACVVFTGLSSALAAPISIIITAIVALIYFLAQNELSRSIRRSEHHKSKSSQPLDKFDFGFDVDIEIVSAQLKALAVVKKNDESVISTVNTHGACKDGTAQDKLEQKTRTISRQSKDDTEQNHIKQKTHPTSKTPSLVYKLFIEVVLLTTDLFYQIISGIGPLTSVFTCIGLVGVGLQIALVVSLTVLAIMLCCRFYSSLIFTYHRVVHAKKYANIVGILSGNSRQKSPGFGLDAKQLNKINGYKQYSDRLADAYQKAKQSNADKKTGSDATVLPRRSRNSAERTRNVRSVLKDMSKRVREPKKAKRAKANTRRTYFSILKNTLVMLPYLKEVVVLIGLAWMVLSAPFMAICGLVMLGAFFCANFEQNRLDKQLTQSVKKAQDVLLDLVHRDRLRAVASTEIDTKVDNLTAQNATEVSCVEDTGTMPQYVWPPTPYDDYRDSPGGGFAGRYLQSPITPSDEMSHVGLSRQSSGDAPVNNTILYAMQQRRSKEIKIPGSQEKGISRPVARRVGTTVFDFNRKINQKKGSQLTSAPRITRRKGSTVFSPLSCKIK